jgi:hypothetical protein
MASDDRWVLAEQQVRADEQANRQRDRAGSLRGEQTIEDTKARIKRQADVVRQKVKEAADRVRAKQAAEERTRQDVYLKLIAEADEWVHDELEALVVTAVEKGKNVVDLSIDDARAAACRRAGFEVRTNRDSMSGWDTFEVVIP